MHLESEFTKPRADCPHPEYWHAYDDMATEVEVIEFVCALVRALQPELVVETGTWKAYASMLIGEALRENEHGHLITLETDADMAQEAARKLSHLPVKVEQIDSREYKPPAPIDLLWIDGSTDRIGEWKHLGQYLAKHGIVVVHDTGPHRDARSQLNARTDLKIIHLPTPRGVSIGQKQ